MSRRELREHTFLLLFRHGFYTAEDMEEQIDLYLNGMDQENLTEAEKSEIKVRVKNILSKMEELDEKIEAVSEGWKASRMGKVELTVIRLSLFEILFDEQVPKNVAINEAVEISKKFGGDDSSSFVNGILAKLVA